MGDVGGVQDFFILILGMFVFPFSEFRYNLKMFQKLFLVNTKDKSIIDFNADTQKKGRTLEVEPPLEIAQSDIV